MSTAADARTAHRMTRGGAGFRRRLRHAAAVLLLGTGVLGACTVPSAEPDGGTTPEGFSPATTAEQTLDPAVVEACTTFWGDPDYTRPLSRDVLDRAGTASENGASDPMFYALTGDDVDAAFSGAPAELQGSANAVAEWFRTEAAQGAEGDLEALRTAMDGLAQGCAPVSDAAAWFHAPGEDGTKPAALTCADIFDTPSTFTVFGNANVLTSNMFKLVGRTPQTVPEDEMDQVEATLARLDQEIAAVDDDGVREALTAVRGPFADAVAGDLGSPGLQEPLEQLGGACGAVGYDAGVGAQEQDEQDDEDGEGLV